MTLATIQGYQYPTYIDNASGMEDDCVPAAIAYVIGVKRNGNLPPDSVVQAAFQKWQGGKAARWVGLTLAKFYAQGLDGYKPACFGPVAKSQRAHQYAIDTYGGFIAGLMNTHEVAAVGYDADSIHFVSAGTLTKLAWPQWLAMVDSSTYAFSDKPDSALAGGFWWYIAKWFGGWL